MAAPAPSVTAIIAAKAQSLKETSPVATALEALNKNQQAILAHFKEARAKRDEEVTAYLEKMRLLEEEKSMIQPRSKEGVGILLEVRVGDGELFTVSTTTMCKCVPAQAHPRRDLSS
jgi:hypothetical protein